VNSYVAADVPATYKGHDTRARFDDFRMCEYEWQCEAGNHDKRGDKTAEVDRARALAVVGGEVFATAVGEERVGKGSDYEGQRCPRTGSYQTKEQRKRVV